MATVQELRKQITDYINDPTLQASDLENVISLLNKPMLEKFLQKWAEKKSLPPRLVENLSTKLATTNKLTLEEKIEFVNDLANGNNMLDFNAMIRNSHNKKVSIYNYIKSNKKKIANWVIENYRDVVEAQLLGAPTNIGKGELVMIILGGLSKPSKGDLQTSSEMIEVKEGGGAAMIPKRCIHPNKILSGMRNYIRSKHADLGKLMPTRDSGGGEDTLAWYLSIQTRRTGNVFPLGELARTNGISIESVRDVMQEYHDRVYAGSLRFDVKKYIQNDYKFKFNEYGEENFASLFEGYRSEYGFTNLMYFNIGHGGGAKRYGGETVYCIKNKSDAKAFWKKYGTLAFTGADTFGRAYGYGGSYSETKYRGTA